MPQISLPPAGIAAGRAAGPAMRPASVRDAGERASFPRASEQGANRQVFRADRHSGIAAARGPARVERAIADAARRTGVDFDFLLAQARVESAMDPDARAATSSARGLYQFIEGTWLSTMERHGARFGLGDVAARITRAPGGGAQVADPAERRAILAMRQDPEIAALMAAGLAEDNRAHLTRVLGRQPDDPELYLAHFLGAGGAARFLSEMARDPERSAADLFPRPAAANRPVFHDAGGRTRSLAEVMEHLTAKMARAQASGRATAPPDIRADETVFALGDPSALSGKRSPAIRPRATLAMPRIAETVLTRTPSPAPSMSRILAASLDGIGPDTPALERAGESIRAAYEKLKALGL